MEIQAESNAVFAQNDETERKRIKSAGTGRRGEGETTRLYCVIVDADKAEVTHRQLALCSYSYISYQ